MKSTFQFLRLISEKNMHLHLSLFFLKNKIVKLFLVIIFFFSSIYCNAGAIFPPLTLYPSIKTEKSIQATLIYPVLLMVIGVVLWRIDLRRKSKHKK